MLLLSYMLAGALELSVMISLFRAGERLLLWSYGFLLFSSLVAIPVETGQMGKAVREEMRNTGIDVARYDTAGNLLRSAVYVLVLRGLVTAQMGAVLAYGAAIGVLVLAVWRMSKL